MSATPKFRWRLARVTIHQFRGVAGEQTYAFDGCPGLLHGNNGVGKSTLVVAVQWILYGRFPAGVLQNTVLDRFLAPVGQKGRPFSGEVVFTRGDESLVLRRGEDGFTLETGDKKCEGDEAETARDALLGLDMDTFVRAVLLQQSRIRSLLLDEPKERNKALDRLLGMDVIEHLVEVVKPKDFETAARTARASIDSERHDHESKERVLAEQLETAQERARSLDFKNKDLNPTGLEARYAEVGKELVELAKKHKVEVDVLPACNKVKDVPATQKAFAKGIKSIRIESEPKKRSAPLDQRIASLTSFAGRWRATIKARDESRAKLAGLVEKHGDVKVLLDERASADTKAKGLKHELKAANALRELLGDARDLVDGLSPKDCPVCEQALPATLDLSARLRKRIERLASDELVKIQANLKKVQARVAGIDEALATVAATESEINRTQFELDALRAKVVEALGGAGIAENKIQKRIEEVLAKDEQEREALKTALGALEDELHAASQREGAIREGLVPVLQKRDEIAAHEQVLKKLKVTHAGTVATAERLEQLATQVEAIKRALLEAKKELATELLKKAAPRAQELYQRLVRQPVFDTLDVRVDAKAAKVDYAFAVRSGDSTATARDARLVLSDGQLTGTALALFFGLAESTAHELDLLCIDDPTQNLDLPSKEAMAKVVAEVAAKRQVIVATQDEDFVSFLKSEGFPAEAVVHHLKSWDGNPSVETAVPEGITSTGER